MANAAKADKAAQVVAGVNTAKVNLDHLKGVLKQLKLPTTGTPAELVERAVAHFKKATPPERLANCDVCDGASDITLDACPFCATVEGDAAATESDVKPKAAAKAAKADKAPKAAAKADKPSSKALVKAAPTAVVVTTESQPLDAAVADVQRLKEASSVSAWQLGKRIRDVFEGQLWKLRVDADGKPRYKGFDAFVAHELGFTPTNAYKLMDLSKTFAEDDVRKFGTSKLGLLIEAPKEDQARIKEQIEKGASKREVEREVRKAKKEKGHRRDTGRKKTPAGTRKPAARATITVANITGRKTVKLFKKPASRTQDPSEFVRAKKVGDLPWGKMELENDVTMYFSVQENAAGELQLVVETKREAE